MHVCGDVGTIISLEKVISPRVTEVATRLWNGVVVVSSFYAAYTFLNKLRRCVDKNWNLSREGDMTFRCGSVVVSAGTTCYVFKKLSL